MRACGVCGAWQQVMFEPMIDVTESIQELLEKRLEAISRVKSSWDRNSIAKHQLHFLTSIIDRVCCVRMYSLCTVL